MKKTLLLLSAIFMNLLVIAGNPITRICGSMDNLQRLKTEDPALESRMQQIENQTSAYLMNYNSQNRVNAVITIPVVFHVVYNSTSQNISDAQCQAQLDQLNLDFAKLNANASSIPSAFQGIAANTNIQFCLAQRDANGAATTGIERRQTTVSSFSTNDNVKRVANGGLAPWDATKYLNIWSCNISGGVLGYAQFPGGSNLTDGVVLLYSSIGSVSRPGTASPYNLGRTATHEVGHWLNLRHIWGDDGSACSGSDQVGDTPNQADENYGCPSYPLTDGCTSSSPGVMFMNYMDYTDDACMNMFTSGQSSRMNSLFSAGGARVGIVSSLGCVAPSGSVCSVPSGLTATSVTSTGATLSWTAVSGAVSYNVQYKLSSASTFTTVNTTSTSYVLSGLTASSAYQYQVQTVCNSGSSAYSAASSFTTTAAATCGVPSGLNATSITTTAATLNWAVVSGATSYSVRYKLSSSSTWTTVSSATNSLARTGLTASTLYDFSVAAICASGTSAFSATSTFTTASVATCGVPSGLSSGSISTSSAVVSWTAVSGATSYNVQYRITGAAIWTTTTSATNSKSLTALSAGTVYQFQVQTVCSGGTSVYSATGTFTTAAAGCSDQYESNNSRSTAKTIATNTDITGLIPSSSDVDWFRFTTSSPNTKIKITLTNLAGDYDIRLYNSSGNSQLAISQNAGTTSETIIRNTSSASSYYVYIYGYNGAASSTQCYSLRISVSNSNYRTGDEMIEQINGPVLNSMEVYPNPAHDLINAIFNSEVSENTNIRVFDMVGKVVYSSPIFMTEGSNKFSVDLTGYTRGIYFMELTNSSERIVKKFIVE